MRIALLLSLALLVVCHPMAVQADDENPRTQALPPGWTVVRPVDLATSHVKAISKNFDASLVAVSNDIWSVNGFQVQVNTIEAANQGQADKCFDALSAMRPGFVGKRGKYLVEVAGTNRLVARRVLAALEMIDDAPTTWKGSVRVGLVDDLDYMTANPLFNHFIALERGAEGDEEAEIQRLSKDWTMGRTKELLTEKRPWFEATYLFEPEPASKAGAAVTAFTFEDPPTRLGIPYVDVAATVTVRPRFVPVVIEGDKGSLAPTRFWPAADPAIVSLAQELAKNAETGREQVLALLRYLATNVKYGGQTGSRYGVKKVLAQGFGHCWDKSDVLITLCRALGIPAREVAGWVPVMNSGHVWTEVKIPGEGWIPVDATTTWIGVSADYVPLYRTNDGHMPIVYLGWPKFERE